MSADPNDIATVDGDATPTDPGAIDLEHIKKYTRRDDARFRVVTALIAAVEALRERVDTLNIVDGFLAATAEKNLIRAEAAEARVKRLETQYNLYKHVAKSVRGALDGEHTQRDILKVFDEQVDRVEAAEACEMKLARVLEAQCDLIESNSMLSACASSTLEPARALLKTLFARLEKPAGKRD